ncbi:hypothetical protein [Rhodococcoides corynebacterioides]|uniref:Uncharacterized protein n=1 Tax=Rhodococcoides corynebacterioides TaxID=53972 RepID=A0ABS7P6L6_9NOCA|nr:hypothetical protein [Rhodococcus corynebacterioides]MBY6367985.1 hypothetical protein [Rhodococcus corynebacterioides]MBY6409539.1 hypothetical protein [Rhodococcus corynebacterioides]
MNTTTATATGTHRMSDAELRKAIAVMQSRADDARRRGETEDADRIDRTVQEFREEMATRL